jgi:hypothetical protein
MVAEVKPLQNWKAASPIDCAAFIDTVVNEKRPWNALPTLFMEFIDTVCTSPHPWNASLPIYVTLSMITLDNAPQLENADVSIKVTLSMITNGKLLQLANARSPMISAAGIDTLCKLLQPLNASLPMEVTLFTCTVLKLQFWNALSPNRNDGIWYHYRGNKPPILEHGIANGNNIRALP